MRYAATFSSIPDGYRAGVALGEGLVSIEPEVAIVFFSERYLDQAGELVAGLRDALGDRVLLCGGSGDGVYWREGVANHGAVALGISSAGAARWAGALARGVGANSAVVARAVAELAQRRLERPASFAMVLADGCRADGAGLVEGLSQSLRCPCFGGLTADDRKFVRTVAFLGDDVAEDAVMLLVADGEVPLRLGAASGWTPIGERACVTQAEGSRVRVIDGLPANTFVRNQLGMAVRGADLGIVPLAEFTVDGDGFVLRTPSAVDERTGEINLFGRIPQGSTVQVCRATLADVLAGVDSALDGVEQGGFTPAAGLFITCAGRRWLLTDSGREEVERVRRRLGDVPFIGLPSFGEIAPLRRTDGSYSAPLFHNVTFVACVLGR